MQSSTLSKARLKNLGDNNIKKIQNILKIRGVKGSILLDLFPKRGGQGPPGYGPDLVITFQKENRVVLFHNLMTSNLTHNIGPLASELNNISSCLLSALNSHRTL